MLHQDRVRGGVKSPVDKNFYEILEIQESATTDEIKKAFKRLATACHPDVKGGDESKFKELNEAYQTLSDDSKRAHYDLGGHFGCVADRQGPEINPPSIDDLFTDLWDFPFQRRGPPAPYSAPRQEPGDDIIADLILSLKESLSGCRKQIKVSGPRPNVQCGTCGGGGSQPGTRRVMCSSCAGRGGYVGFSNPEYPGVRTCPVCRGQGTIPLIPCQKCKGTGRTVYVKEIVVNVPPGISEGQQLRMAGMGSPGYPPGDLYLNIRVRASSEFWRQGQDIHTSRRVTLGHAILGGPLRIEGPDGAVREVAVPPGTQPGDLVKVPGAGVVGALGGTTGDFIMHVVVQLPKTVSERAKKLLDELCEELTRRGPKSQ